MPARPIWDANELSQLTNISGNFNPVSMFGILKTFPQTTHLFACVLLLKMFFSFFVICSLFALSLHDKNVF